MEVPHRKRTAENNELRKIHIQRHKGRRWNSVAASCRNVASTRRFLEINTQVIWKVSTVCAYLSRILETATLRIFSDFLYQLRSHRRHFVKFILCLYLFLALNVFKTIEGVADCEIRSVIRFLKARNVLPSEIHHQTCQVYGDNAMSDGMVRKWVRMFNEGRENVHDEARSGRPSLGNDDLMRKVNERVRDDRRFTISDLSLHFPPTSRTLL